MDLGLVDPGRLGEAWRYYPADMSDVVGISSSKRGSEPNDGRCLCSHHDCEARHPGWVHSRASRR